MSGRGRRDGEHAALDASGCEPSGAGVHAAPSGEADKRFDHASDTDVGEPSRSGPAAT